MVSGMSRLFVIVNGMTKFRNRGGGMESVLPSGFHFPRITYSHGSRSPMWISVVPRRLHNRLMRKPPNAQQGRENGAGDSASHP